MGIGNRRYKKMTVEKHQKSWNLGLNCFFHFLSNPLLCFCVSTVPKDANPLSHSSKISTYKLYIENLFESLFLLPVIGTEIHTLNMLWRLLAIVMAVGAYRVTTAAKASFSLSEEQVLMVEKGTLRYALLSNGQKSVLFEKFVRENKRKVLLILLLICLLADTLKNPLSYRIRV